LFGGFFCWGEGWFGWVKDRFGGGGGGGVGVEAVSDRPG